MALFQTAVLNKYLKEQEGERVAAAYAKFTAHFHDAAIQANIREAKEEQYQEGFLRDLFVNVLGYTLNPHKDFELTSEFKNEKGAKKADGAILQKGKALAVIELKGTDTTDLHTINVQAFNYKANHTDCVYVVTSNFHKLRFFIDNAVEHLEFDLFTLKEEEFRLLWLCLQRDNLLGGIPKKVKAESLQQEEKITKLLYKDYSTFKNALWQDLCTNHPEHDKLVLYKKSQKLLDRFLFVLFSEDKGLLPPNTLRGILEQWRKLTELDEYRPLYERCQKYFGWLNTGYKSSTQEIFAYNGGLFKPDELLDSVRISDAVLETHLTALHKYDFGSEVDVNILGHIFEHSLNEIENITAQLEGRAVDSKKTKRKKDGVFYTPKYITQYIVEHTVGRLCTEKKDELGVLDEEYAKGRKGRQKKTIQELDTKLDVYRDWLLSLTICDPACGSGAFLNQALDFLIAEHRYVDTLQASLLGHSITFKDIGDHILERNIYGVDINEESVEIARLSLWLRTATKGRKLNDLSSNIKCGNSLIDDPAVAGDKAFDWISEFPNVFAKGGFDVVIGNPPYLRVQGLKEHYPELTLHYEDAFESATGNYDIYVLFIEKSYGLINKNGNVCFILPHKFLIADFGIGLRHFLVEKRCLQEIVHFGSDMVFEDASTYTCIITLTRVAQDELMFKEIRPSSLFDSIQFSRIDYIKLNSDQWILTNQLGASILNKVFAQPLQLKDVFRRFVQGIITGKDAVFCVTGEVQGDYLKVSGPNGMTHLLETQVLKPHLRGEDVNKYRKLRNQEWLIFPYKIDGGKARIMESSELQSIAPNTFLYLQEYEDLLRSRENGKFNVDDWYQYSRNQAISVMEQEKIITPEVCFGGSMTIDVSNFYHNSKCHSLLLSKGTGFTYTSILPILNSRLFWFYLSVSGNVLRGGYVGVKRKVLEPFGIPLPDKIDGKKFSSFAEHRIETEGHIQSVHESLQSLLQSKYTLPKLSRTLENWPALDFKGFLKELKKAKVSLSLAEEAEWLGYFTEQQAKAHALQAQIDKTDKEIDVLVYQLYGLTAEEVGVVEGR